MATKEIANKFSSNQYGLEHIQADFYIQGKNSYETLLDKYENVVGISYAGISVALEIPCYFFKLKKRNDPCEMILILMRRFLPCKTART